QVEGSPDQIGDGVVSVEHEVVVPDGVGVIPGLVETTGQTDVSAIGIYSPFVLVLGVVLTVDIETGPVDQVQVLIEVVLQGGLPEDPVGLLYGSRIGHGPEGVLNGVILPVVYAPACYRILKGKTLHI